MRGHVFVILPYQDFSYAGRENPVVKESTYYLEFICYYDLTWFPFDTQYCTVNMSLLSQASINTALSTCPSSHRLVSVLHSQHVPSLTGKYQYCTLHSLCKQITIGEENTEQKDCKYNISNEARL